MYLRISTSIHHGQRVEPQDQADPRLVCQACKLADPFHPDVLVMDQPGRALLRTPDRTADQARRPPVHQGLEAAVAAYINARNKEPKAFRWTKTAEDILASIQRFCRRTIKVQAQRG